jgi:hypothetical protein
LSDPAPGGRGSTPPGPPRSTQGGSGADITSCSRRDHTARRDDGVDVNRLKQPAPLRRCPRKTSRLLAVEPTSSFGRARCLPVHELAAEGLAGGEDRRVRRRVLAAWRCSRGIGAVVRRSSRHPLGEDPMQVFFTDASARTYVAADSLDRRCLRTYWRNGMLSNGLMAARHDTVYTPRVALVAFGKSSRKTPAAVVPPPARPGWRRGLSLWPRRPSSTGDSRVGVASPTPAVARRCRDSINVNVLAAVNLSGHRAAYT